MLWANLNAPAFTADDMARAASALRCEEAAIRAVWQVETRGQSYDDDGRLAALFEPHHFYRLLGQWSKRDAAVRAGLAYPRWRAGNYPPDSYPRILAACAIDEEAALQATSWGGPQIMGFNYKTVGYPSVLAMHAAFLTGEAPQVEAFVQFVLKNGLDDEIRRRDWAGFARRYNGPGYAANQYDVRLARAYRHFKVGKPMAVMIAPLPPPGPMPSTLRAETVPETAPKPASSTSYIAS